VVPGPPASLMLWVPVALVPALVTLYLSPAILVGPLDWNLYREDLGYWLTRGSPYVVPAQTYSPYETYAYTYPPTSWPLLLVSILPPAFVWVAVIPLLARPPQIWLVPVSAALLSLGLAIGISLGNVSVLMAGLLVLSFQPGKIGGIAFAGVVALRLYPLVLLPFLWSDRVRLKWFVATFGVLLVSGTLLFGLTGWRDWMLIIARLSSDIGLSWNPFGWLGALRIVPAIGIAVLGLWLRSPTLTLLGATWINGHVTDHYLITIAAVLPFERKLSLPLRPNLSRPQRPRPSREADTSEGPMEDRSGSG
jgi:hypothetical protein